MESCGIGLTVDTSRLSRLVFADRVRSGRTTGTPDVIRLRRKLISKAPDGDSCPKQILELSTPQHCVIRGFAFLPPGYRLSTARGRVSKRSSGSDPLTFFHHNQPVFAITDNQFARCDNVARLGQLEVCPSPKTAPERSLTARIEALSRRQQSPKSEKS